MGGAPQGLITAHRELAVAVVLVSLVGAIWAGYVASRLAGGRRLPLFGSLMTSVLLLQALFGVVLASLGARPQDGLHFLFGPLTLAALPVARGAARTQPAGERAQALVIAAGWLVTLAVGLRAVGTGGGLT